ncbi:MAG TPA: D-alanine--D-alanine ligase family protein, partial [Chloroflexota bacterium]|nr:D-alanine--D-alanine ligase family protein [Chloroflexota bacterium]
CMDKDVFKAVLRDQGIPVTANITLRAGDEARNPFGYPCFVKPANLGSSVGVSKAHDAAELERAVELAARYDAKIVVERAVPEAREIECAVLGNDSPEASVPGEIVPSREFYDYAAKYLDGTSELHIPAQLLPQQAEHIRRWAIKAFQAVDCSGLARADFLLSRTTGELYLNELNTMPGFTAISMYPKLWEATGLSLERLLDRLLQLALERHRQRAALSTALNQ